MRASALLALAACGARPHAAPRETPPTVDLITLLGEADPLWPLTELPSVQPHLDVAMAHDACDPAFAKRHGGDDELIRYVRTWCRLRADGRAALDELAALAHDARPELQRAARLDVVNLLADYKTADDAIAYIHRMDLDREDMLDLLAATYHALGMTAEMRTVGRVVLDRPASLHEQCERALEWSRLDDPDLRDRLERAARDTGPCSARAKAALVRCKAL